MTDPAIIEAAFEALQEETGYGMSDDNAREFSRIILNTATPLIRAAVLKEAAFFDSDKYVRPVLDSVTSLIRDAALEEAAEELMEQWLSNHAEHCGKLGPPWPHEGRCHWPMPEILVRLRALKVKEHP